jgi:hypothetical protein
LSRSLNGDGDELSHSLREARFVVHVAVAVNDHVLTLQHISRAPLPLPRPIPSLAGSGSGSGLRAVRRDVMNH